ncbi:class II glutamine amidotransferase [Paludibacterium yongneupense]|uniref:class II glutamine amidotransferase n=1 Tax=Paludibacterium yongneupense TaxID=400061 RepID=UPI00041E8BC8|nr:class II glutamine amidotransferase [Paludibacterium yongneupense]
MCQLLGMNCNTPTDISFSFEGFHRRGGLTDHHADGWGIAFFEGKGCRLFIDDRPSCDSPVAEMVRRYPLKSENVIAHIRKATQGVVSLANTHPFIREMWGRYWIFAHNGNLHDFDPAPAAYFHPVGSTDSERAFCLLLERLRQRWSEQPSQEEVFDAIAEVVDEVTGHGIFNFILSNGEALFAHCSTHLHYLVRQAPFQSAHLIDEDITVDFSTLTTPQDRIAVIATQPLTDNEHWTRLLPGELLMFSQGRVALRRQGTHPPVEASVPCPG